MHGEQTLFVVGVVARRSGPTEIREMLADVNPEISIPASTPSLGGATSVLDRKRVWVRHGCSS
jgi:hypothetical protein